MTDFNVHFNVADMDGKAVLVFLKPEAPRQNCHIHAWQVLIGTEGSTKSFDHHGLIQANVTSIDGGLNAPLISEKADFRPHRPPLFQAVLLDESSLTLREAPLSLAQAKLSPNQFGVTNHVNPFMPFDCNWFVDGQPVATMPDVDTNMTVSFECLMNLYFMVAKPPVAGQTYLASDFSDMTRYVVPLTARSVDVDLTRKNELWAFNFSSRS